jgi:hypothetical protein
MVLGVDNDQGIPLFLESHMATIDELKRGFVQLVKARAYDDGIIDQNEEKAIVMQGLGQGLSVDSIRAALAQVCEQNGYLLESGLMREMKELLLVLADRGRITRQHFDFASDLMAKKLAGKKTLIEIQRSLIEIISHHRLKVRTGWFTNWYRSLKRELS